MSPHEALFGTKPIIPQFSDIQKKSYATAKQHFDNLEAIRQTAQSNIEKGTKKSTDQANKDRRPPTKYYPNELVLLRRPRLPKDGQTKKFLPHYSEPYEVVKRLSDILYLVVPQGKKDIAKAETAHISKMKRYYTRSVNTLFAVVKNRHVPICVDKKILRTFTITNINYAIEVFCAIKNLEKQARTVVQPEAYSLHYSLVMYVRDHFIRKIPRMNPKDVAVKMCTTKGLYVVVD